MKKRTILSLLLAALMLLSFAACTGSAAATAPKADAEPAVKIKFTAIYDDTTKEFNLETTEKTLGAALLKEGIIEGTDSEYGLFVTTVDGRVADDTKQEWWCLTKGGEMWMNGVDTTEIADGDAYEFTLTVGW